MNLKVKVKSWGLHVSIDAGDFDIVQVIVSLREKIEFQEVLLEALDAVSADINEKLREKGII